MKYNLELKETSTITSKQSRIIRGSPDSILDCNIN